MSETFFSTETARADRKNTLLFFFRRGGGINFFFLLYGVGKNFRGGVMLGGGGKKLIRLVYKYLFFLSVKKIGGKKYDFKLKGARILKGRYPYLHPPLCDLTLKWSNFFPIDRISRLEKYVMFQHQVCLFSRKMF